MNNEEKNTKDKVIFAINLESANDSTAHAKVVVVGYPNLVDPIEIYIVYVFIMIIMFNI